MAKPDDLYNPDPSVAPSTSMGNDLLSVRASPADFGAQVGQANEALGGTVDKLVTEGTSLAIQRQGMLNETLSTNAESQYAQATGEVYGKYKALKGLDAVNARGDTVTGILGLRQKIRDSLPNPAAQRAFDLLAVRREGFMLQDVNGYAAGQIKEADSASAMASLNTAVDAAGRPETASNPAAFAESLGNIKFQATRVVGNQGYSSTMHQDPATGVVTFDDSDMGRNAKSVYDNFLNTALTKAYENKYDFLAFDPEKGNVQTAVKELNDDRGKMPAAAYSRIAAKLSGPYKAAMTREGSNDVLSKWEGSYQSTITGQPTTLGAFSPEDFNKDAQGTLTKILGTDVTITSDYRPTDVNKAIPGASPTSEHLTANAWDYTANGLSTKDSAIRLAQILQAKGIKFDQIIDEGDHVHVGFGPKARGEVMSGQPGSFVNLTVPKPAGAILGSDYVNKADFYETHVGEIGQDLRKKAEEMFPDNPQLADQMYTNGMSKVNDVIRTQRLSLRADEDTLYGAIGGKYTGGHPITSADQLYDIPEVAETWRHYQAENPIGASAIETKVIPSYSRGAASTYGTQFYDYFSNALSGKNSDLGSIAGGINPHVAPKDSPLTNSGYSIVRSFLKDNGTPEGQAFNGTMMKWLNSPDVRGSVTATGMIPGASTPELDTKFNQFLMETLPKIQAGRARGVTAGQMFDPKSPEYVGGSLPHYKATMDDLVRATKRIPISPSTISSVTGSGAVPTPPSGPINPNTIKTQDDLFKAALHLTRQQFGDLAIKLGLARPAPPEVPIRK